MAMTTILGIFDTAAQARRAMEDLRSSSLQLEDTSIVSRSDGAGDGVSDEDHLTAGEGAVVGAVWGGIVGVVALLIPGIGPFIAGGALFAAITGAAAGAVVGGVAGALIDKANINEEDAKRYETMVHEGKTLVAVKAREEDALEVRRIMARDGAESIRDNQTDLTSGGMVHVAMYDEAGRRMDEASYGDDEPASRLPDSPRTVNTTQYGGTVVDDRRATYDDLGDRRAGEIEATNESRVDSYEDEAKRDPAADPYVTRPVDVPPSQDKPKS